MNIVQFIWEWFQVEGKKIFFAAGPWIVGKVVDFMFTMLYTIVVKPVVSTLEKVDNVAMQLIDKLMKGIKSIEAMIPKPIIWMVKTCVSQALKGVIEILAPGLQNQVLMNIQLARSIVESHKMEKAAIEQAQREFEAATAAAAKQEKDLLAAIEDKSNRPVIKMEKKAYEDNTESGSGPGKKSRIKKRRPPEPTGPTPSPTHMNRDWGESGGSEKAEETWHDDDYEPGDVELPPQTAEDKKLKAKAMKSDSVLRNTEDYLARHKEKKSKKAARL
jgi:hypothetical protein